MFKRPREDNESEVQGKALKLSVKFSPLVQTTPVTGSVKQVNRIKNLDLRVINQHPQANRTEEVSPEEQELVKLTQETNTRVIECGRLYRELGERDEDIMQLSQLIQTEQMELLSVTQHCDDIEEAIRVQTAVETAELDTWVEALKREQAMLGTERKKQESVRYSLQQVQSDSAVIQDYSNALERSCGALKAEVIRMEKATEEVQIRRLQLHSEIASEVVEAEALAQEVAEDQEAVSFLEGEIASFANGVFS